jgi:uncharacterized protein DUF3892
VTTEVQITCITKTNRLNPHERIDSVGGIYPDGRRWRLTQQEAVSCIENGNRTFSVRLNGSSAWVMVAVGQYGDKYLKMAADDEHSNKLLSLPDCPK